RRRAGSPRAGTRPRPAAAAADTGSVRMRSRLTWLSRKKDQRLHWGGAPPFKPRPVRDGGRSSSRARHLRRFGVDEEGLALADDGVLVHHDFAHVLHRRQIEHQIEQHLFQDRTQAPGAGLSRQGFLGDRLQRLRPHLQIHSFHAEQLLILLDESVLRLGQYLDQGLLEILTEPKNALIKQYQKLFSMEGVDLEVRPQALQAIAKKALARKTGARGLRSILEQVLLDLMFDLPTMENVSKVVVDENTIVGEGKPLLIYTEPPKVAGTA